MYRPEFGTKCTCASCDERFYDLNRSPAVCPKCGATQPPATVRAPRPARANLVGARINRRPMPAVAEEEAEPLPIAEDDEDADTDTDAAEDVPELDVDMDADVDPTIVRD